MRIKKPIQDVLRRNEPGELTLNRVIAELRSMRSPASPRLVPEFDLAVHIVLDDFGTAGRVYRETDEERARLDTVSW